MTGVVIELIAIEGNKDTERGKGGALGYEEYGT